MHRRAPAPQRGFTMVELVIVIVIGGIVAATLAVFFRPALDAWLALRTRADLADQATTALRAMQREVRTAVPNSVRTPNDQCFELVPTIAGGRFRKQADTANAAALPLDVSTATATFDTLTSLQAVPSAGDYVVVGNQNPGDVYSLANVGTIASVTAAPAGTGVSRITLAAATSFPAGYDGGRFVVVPASQQAVSYVCSGASGVDANGDGLGTLLRYSAYGFNAAVPAACRTGTGGAVVATHVKSCSFIYDPNQGATQQSGFVSMQVTLSTRGETASLLMGAHVINVP